MEFCFFAVMGGFRVSIKDIRPSESAYFRSSYNGALPEDLALSPDGIRLLAQLGHLNLLLPHASDVEDKNKSNGFQKLLVMVQLSWMLLQCIFRGNQKLPISLLEIHTFGHAYFALLLYIAWFSKPADISHPINIPTDAFADALALMVQEQFCEAQNIMTCLYPQRTHENELSMLAVRADPETMPPSDERDSPSLIHFKDSEGELKKVTWIAPTDTFSELCITGDEADGVALPCGMSYAKMFRLPTIKSERQESSDTLLC
ncbi:hypothetical protein GE21DRAFT_3836 [Neurospora crassa]|uniref:Uncharacterized protein n=1 Tax=Neurospora crassa (strain ATCC 24698 / 74-OR23-1A / CBS 708.71 / DSM 1257 / FGSC 987) TaxID=367110 RepID=Q7S338_NEUCR|nr:hypothetical protein NCU09177 [Neurospora crassa OR74A]EAA29851.1 hypothetical protein NCU09177 [Neurospora crassa OR74A]KHE84344.1 hypothetical protein GE21DRAFT_3836 [Neurospora crassa]|eukprot:XP_959087.1 hypothetical protein NCU09177 [Neurospora crassa OR74A]